MITSGTIMVNIFINLILWFLLFIVSWIINKYILKKSKKHIIAIAIMLWIIIFVINVFAVVTDIPITIGIPTVVMWDGGSYIVNSLGYKIYVKIYTFEEKRDISFKNIFQLENEFQY